MIRVKNWSSYQSYKDRMPPWIRLHRSLLDNFEFQSLSDKSRALLPMLWLLACEDKDPTSGLIPHTVDKISFRLRQTKSDINASLVELQDAGFIECIESVTESLRIRIQNVTPETETETETETEADTRCPVEKIVDAYHRLMPENPRCKVLNPARRGAIKARWNEAAKLSCSPFGYSTVADGIAAWEVFFETCANSKFLTGKTKPQEGKPPFFADIDFLMSPAAFAKCLENKYHRD